MGLISYKLGQTSVVLRVKIYDSTSSTGAGLTGLTSASSGLRISAIADNEAATTSYTVAGSTIETITTLGTYAAPTATKCRFKEVDATNHPGVYELQFADARLAVSSAKSLLVTIKGATNAAECDALIPLPLIDPYTAPGSTGGLVICGSNAGVTLYSLTVSTVALFEDDVQVLGVLQTEGQDGVKLLPNSITAATIFSDAGTEIAAAVWNAATSGLTTVGSIGKKLADATFGGGSGTGARTVTITVNDGTTVLENALVRMTEGANTYTALTNASGVATFNLDDATYTVSVTKQGYTYSGTTLVVNGTEAATYSMAQVSITPPSDPALTAAYLTTYDAQGAIAGSTVITFKLEDGAGTTGYSYSTAPFEATSNASTGLLTVNLIKSTSYSARRGGGEWVDFTTGSGSTYALPEILGTL